MAEIVLKVSTGSLKGLKKTTALNSKQYYSFQGIPYAEPPTGQNRFKDPVPCKPWNGVRDATKEGNMCPQFHEFFKRFTGEEDCLFLNVYTPKLPNEGSSSDPSLLPVMVFIHGGGFTFGSGNSDGHGADFLVEYDVILVTVNYRVGVFGFLSLGNSDVPGNAGLKDQNLALKWVQQNIKYFGGDSNNVTLFGESAGAASVHYQAMSPLSHGLMHKVILQSGTAFNPWASCDNPVSRAFRLGKALGCETDNADQLVDFLRSQTSETLVENQGNILSSYERTKLIFPFVPCKEVPGTGENFLTEDPEVLMESGRFSKIPFILGMNDREGIIMLKEMSNLVQRLSNIDNDPLKFVPLDLCKGNVNENVVKKVKQFYFEGKPLSSSNLAEFCDLAGDMDFVLSNYKLLRFLSLHPEVPVYNYLFTFEGELGLLKRYIKLTNTESEIPAGVCHADDIGYLFYNNMVASESLFEKTSNEDICRDRFCSLWTNFAKTSDPNDEKFGVVWKRYTKQQPTYLDIGETLKIVDSDMFFNKLEFWKNIYESERLVHKL